MHVKHLPIGDTQQIIALIIIISALVVNADTSKGWFIHQPSLCGKLGWNRLPRAAL